MPPRSQLSKKADSKRTGRPTDYTAAKHKAIVKSVRKGNRIPTAAALIGVHKGTLMKWLADGERNEDSPYRKLYEDVAQALALWEEEMLAPIMEAAISGKPQTWQAGMTILERRMPEHYGRRDAVTVEGRTEIAIFSPTPEQLATILKDLDKMFEEKSADLELVEGDGYREEGS